ncbi:Mce protein [Mycobacterium sp. NPDC048908]|uniref:Mce protein n=1 Tax=Mycobacterium sp. NPDC048908 TaxID=3364292 RepID=UPI003713916C
MADDAAAPGGEVSESTATDPESSGVEVSDAVAADEVTDSAEDTEHPGEAAKPAKAPMSHVMLGAIIGIVLVVALAGLTGWLGFRAYQSHQTDEREKLFLQVGRQGALDLTTIDWQHADADVQRILDSATGTFYDDFQRRAQPFTEVVKQAQSKSEGSIAEAGLVPESITDNGADVLVAMTVKTANAGAPEQAPRAWRMRISVEKVGDEAKVANVEFVP